MKININIEIYLFVAHFNERFQGTARSGIINKYINPSKFVQCGFNHFFYVSYICYIDLDSHGFTPQFYYLSGCFLGSVQVFIGRNYIAAFLCKK